LLLKTVDGRLSHFQRPMFASAIAAAAWGAFARVVKRPEDVEAGIAEGLGSSTERSAAPCLTSGSLISEAPRPEERRRRVSAGQRFAAPRLCRLLIERQIIRIETLRNFQISKMAEGIGILTCSVCRFA
jgi:hypothetical protein